MGKRQLRVEGESASRRLQLRQPLQRRSFEMQLRRSVRLVTEICRQNSEKLVRLTFLNYKQEYDDGGFISGFVFTDFR